MSRRRHLPAGPSGWAASRFFVRGSFDGTPEYLLELRRRYGPVTQFRLLTRRIWIASDPEFIREVLVTKARSFVKSRGAERLKLLLGEGLLTSEEPLHLERRHFLQPAFHRERIAQYALAMVDETQREVATWHAGERIDAAVALSRLTLAIAARTLFGANVSRNADEVRSALSTVMGVFPRFLSPLSGLLDRLPVPATRRFAAARARLDAVIYRLIDERRREPGDRGDLLSMLLLARDDAGNALDDLAVRDEAMTIFIAGHETTANALVWSLYLLSQHPDVRSRLEAEIERVLGGAQPRAEDVAQLSYTRMVFAEAMRLYPPAWIVGRRALKDLEVSGYLLRAGEVVLMSQYVVHRDPRLYAEPEAFRPERWAEPGAQNLPKFAYFPFGGGNRVCIGEQFAWMEGILVLATLTQRARLDLEPGTAVDILPLVTLRPRYPMPMTVRNSRGGAAVLTSVNATNDNSLKTEVATFAAGCFWGVESDFRKLPGVIDVTVGYTGGETPNPSYRDVCSSQTGHAEAVNVVFDPSRISYRQLVDHFWTIHDPTTRNRQGPDVGTQYRSAIFTHSDEQMAIAEASKRDAQAKTSRPIVTQVAPIDEFYRGEEYHQRYFEKAGVRH